MRWSRPSAPRAVEPRPEARTVQFIGYATDCVVSGRVAMESDRLTDLLSRRVEYDVQDVSLEVLDNGSVVRLETAQVIREDLCVVAATGPRGDPARRVRTRPHPIAARIGPYEITGYIHAMPSADPVAVALRRAIIPVTLGTIRYQRRSELVERQHDTMLVNRDKIEWLEEATDAGALAPPEMPGRTDPGARDLTGELYAGR